jgi:hypothetical protein
MMKVKIKTNAKGKVEVYDGDKNITDEISRIDIFVNSFSKPSVQLTFKNVEIDMEAEPSRPSPSEQPYIPQHLWGYPHSGDPGMVLCDDKGPVIGTIAHRCPDIEVWGT